MASTRRLCIHLHDVLRTGSKSLFFFPSLPRLERRTSYRPPQKPHSAPPPPPPPHPCMPPRFHYISTCTQFAQTDSCLLLWGRRSENIEPAHCAERQQRRHNSDSSERKAGGKKCFHVQKSSPHFLFFIRRVGQEKGAAPAPSPPLPSLPVRSEVPQVSA